MDKDLLFISTNKAGSDYPELNEVGEERVTRFSMNKDNSNIVEVLGSSPVALDYDVDAITNPDNDDAIRGFMTDSSRYVANVEVELPIYGRASGFAAIDTFDIDFSDFQDIKEVEFKLITKNDLPLEVGMELYFEDQAGKVVDSLFTGITPVLAPAPVDE